MDRDKVMAWVAGYERGWREDDLGAVRRLFTEDARYAQSPNEEEPAVGHEAIEELWLDPESPFTMTSDVVAVEGDRAVVRVEVQYTTGDTPHYRELWVLRFAEDGRVSDFEEWTYKVGKEGAVG